MSARGGALALLAATTLSACGHPGGPTRVEVTADYGASRTRAVTSTSSARSAASLAGITDAPGWAVFVNGLRASAATVPRAGDTVWWDRHAGAPANVRVVVGAFPEPFLHGSGGRRLPVRIECTVPSSQACTVVDRAVTSFGIPAARGGLLLAQYNDTYRVLVGPWAGLRADPAAALIEAGPARSGVFATFAGGLELLAPSGAVIRTLGPRAGLIAATRLRSDPPVWLVTGTDEAGVEAAARAFDATSLHDRFAVAVQNGVVLALPGGRPTGVAIN